MAETGRASKASLEVVRSTIITAHAASSFLVNAGDRQAARLLRAAEGLARQALVLLSVPAAGAQPAGEKEEADGNQYKQKKRRKKKKVVKAGEEGMEVDTPKALLDAAGPGASVWAGDLSEVGVPAGLGLVAAPGRAPRAVGMATLSSSSSPAPSAAPEEKGPGLSSAAEGTGVSSAEARAAMATLPTDLLRELARNLGGSGKGGRAKLEAFCVERRIGGSKRDVGNG